MEFGTSGQFSHGIPGIEPRRARAGRWIALAALLAAAIGFLASYNGLASKVEAVDAAWAQVESAHQRRADLVPALVAAVRRHTQYESQTLLAMVEARTEAVRALSAPRARGDEALTRAARAQSELGAGLHQLVAFVESHPELRAGDSFLELQAQLEGAENRIFVARLAFNDAVRAYNAAIQRLPGVWIARARGMEPRHYFESEEGADRAPALALD